MTCYDSTRLLYIHTHRMNQNGISDWREQARIARVSVNVVNFLQHIDSIVNGSSDFSLSLIRKRMLSDANRRVNDIWQKLSIIARTSNHLHRWHSDPFDYSNLITVWPKREQLANWLQPSSWYYSHIFA